MNYLGEQDQAKKAREIALITSIIISEFFNDSWVNVFDQAYDLAHKYFDYVVQEMGFYPYEWEEENQDYDENIIEWCQLFTLGEIKLNDQ